MRLCSVGVLVLLAACKPAQVGPPPVLVTTAETSGFVRTGRYAEAVALCDDFARAYDGVRCLRLGTTAQARELVALEIKRTGKSKAPAIVIQAGIHAGEIEGKDAGFWFLRDLLDGKVAAGALAAVDVYFIPVLNPDGHERMRPNNRPNQRGPEEMGFRTTGLNLNLNRDYIKLDSPELRAEIALIRDVDPVMLIDLHTTDGAKFEHDIAINVSPIVPRADQLDELAASISAATVDRLTALGHLPVGRFYPAFVVDEDPASGFAVGEPPPRFSNAYMGARSRLGVLVETHSWRTYKERAASTYHALQGVFEQAVTGAARWREVEAASDAADRALSGSVPLLYENDGKQTEIEFRGYAYERRTSEISNAPYLVYDEATPQIWKVPLYDGLKPAIEVTPPAGGYVVDGGFATAVAALLDLHGLAYTWIDDQPELAVEVFRPTKVATDPMLSEGRTRARLTGAWAPETRRLERHALFVPIAQPRARLALYLFEPSSPDSLVAWGFFNAVFERKEYMEPYVVEVEAQAMLADPAVRAAWEAALAADAELAASPAARRDWFYRRHPAWDERVNLVPVFRIDRLPEPYAPAR
jgi:hypothetical protein